LHRCGRRQGDEHRARAGGKGRLLKERDPEDRDRLRQDSVCSIAGASITAHSEITGDFNSAYTVKTTAHTENGPTAVPRDSATTIEAKWLGACKPDQKPGDIVMPGGFKLNLKDAEKLKGLGPK